MADPRRPRRFSEEFKRQIVEPYDNGKPASEIQAEYDLSHSTIHRWIKGINEHGSTRAADARGGEESGLIGVERESGSLKMDVDALKQAAPVFARR